MFETLYEAKQAADNQAATLYHPGDESFGKDHVYIYLLQGQFGVFWHSEDRYVFSYLPDGARLLAHGQVEYDAELRRSLRWEHCASNLTSADRAILKEYLGEARGAAIADLYENLFNKE